MLKLIASFLTIIVNLLKIEKVGEQSIFESLESRQMASASTPVVEINGNQATIVGSEGSDNIVVDQRQVNINGCSQVLTQFNVNGVLFRTTEVVTGININLGNGQRNTYDNVKLRLVSEDPANVEVDATGSQGDSSLSFDSLGRVGAYGLSYVNDETPDLGIEGGQHYISGGLQDEIYVNAGDYPVTVSATPIGQTYVYAGNGNNRFYGYGWNSIGLNSTFTVYTGNGNNEFNLSSIRAMITDGNGDSETYVYGDITGAIRLGGGYDMVRIYNNANTEDVAFTGLEEMTRDLGNGKG